jgi:hypothetical protein
MSFPIPPIIPSELNNLVNIILDTGSIVHGGFVRDLVDGLVDSSWNRDIDVVASENLLTYLKEKNVVLVPKEDGMLYGDTDMATVEFMGYTLDLMIITLDYYKIKSGPWGYGKWAELFRTEDFECNTLYIGRSRKIESRIYDGDITNIVGQIKAKRAFQTRSRPFTTLATIRRYLNRCYKMLKKGYTLMDPKVKLIEESKEHWNTMIYNDITYVYAELEALF